jgi:hypothetical protein
VFQSRRPVRYESVGLRPLLRRGDQDESQAIGGDAVVLPEPDPTARSRLVGYSEIRDILTWATFLIGSDLPIVDCTRACICLIDDSTIRVSANYFQARNRLMFAFHSGWTATGSEWTIGLVPPVFVAGRSDSVERSYLGHSAI